MTLDVTGDRKRPDMVLRLDHRDVLVIEAKLGAAIGQHVDRDAPTIEGGVATKSQLKTYASWISRRNADPADDWPGALVLLTAWTPPPGGYPSKDASGPMESVRTFTQVAKWLLANAGSLDAVASALALDLLSFLKEKKLLDRHFNARDLAAFTLYAVSEDAFRHTFREVMKALAITYPDVGGYGHGYVGTDCSMGAYIGWIYLKGGYQTGGSKFWIGAGVCTEPGPAFDEGVAQETGHEPFFLVYFGDENEKRRSIDLVSGVPEGWLEMKTRPALIATKAVRLFSGDPNRRAEELRAWACDQIGSLARVMKKRP